MIKIAVLGLGEAGSKFANDLTLMGMEVYGWDPKPRYSMIPGFKLSKNNREAVREAEVIFSVNWSSVSESIALEISPELNRDKLFLEMNTSSPELKKSIYSLIQHTEVQFVDLAIMAPVPPKGIHTPMSASGPGAHTWGLLSHNIGLDTEILGKEVGEASSRKLLRSIMYKGMAALIGEALDSAKKMGMEMYMRNQINSLIGGNDEIINRFITGTWDHAERRMHEMEAVVDMLVENGIDPIMTRATTLRLKEVIKLKSQL